MKKHASLLMVFCLALAVLCLAPRAEAQYYGGLWNGGSGSFADHWNGDDVSPYTHWINGGNNFVTDDLAVLGTADRLHISGGNTAFNKDFRVEGAFTLSNGSVNSNDPDGFLEVSGAGASFVQEDGFAGFRYLLLNNGGKATLSGGTLCVDTVCKDMWILDNGAFTFTGGELITSSFMGNLTQSSTTNASIFNTTLNGYGASILGNYQLDSGSVFIDVSQMLKHIDHVSALLGVSGNLILGAGAQLTLDFTGFTLNTALTYDLIYYSGSLSGTFASVDYGGITDWVIDTSTAGKIQLKYVNTTSFDNGPYLWKAGEIGDFRNITLWDSESPAVPVGFSHMINGRAEFTSGTRVENGMHLLLADGADVITDGYGLTVAADSKMTIKPGAKFTNNGDFFSYFENFWVDNGGLVVQEGGEVFSTRLDIRGDYIQEGGNLSFSTARIYGDNGGGSFIQRGGTADAQYMHVLGDFIQETGGHLSINDLTISGRVEIQGTVTNTFATSIHGELTLKSGADYTCSGSYGLYVGNQLSLQAGSQLTVDSVIAIYNGTMMLSGGRVNVNVLEKGTYDGTYYGTFAFTGGDLNAREVKFGFEQTSSANPSRLLAGFHTSGQTSILGDYRLTSGSVYFNLANANNTAPILFVDGDLTLGLAQFEWDLNGFDADPFFVSASEDGDIYEIYLVGLTGAFTGDVDDVQFDSLTLSQYLGGGDASVWKLILKDGDSQIWLRGKVTPSDDGDQVPEPAAWALLLTGLAAGFFVRRRK